MVAKGCAARGVVKGMRATVTAIELLGPEYSHQVRVQLSMGIVRQSWYARHLNRLSDPVVNLNDGNPLHTIQFRQ